MIHQPNRPNVAEVMPLVNAFYAFPENGVGGSLHVVLDDGNIDSVEYCIEYARQKDDLKGDLLGQLLLLMSHTQRRKLANAHDGYGQGHEMTHEAFVEACNALLAKYAQKTAAF